MSDRRTVRFPGGDGRLDYTALGNAFRRYAKKRGVRLRACRNGAGATYRIRTPRGTILYFSIRNDGTRVDL
jgi:hypothetical protein